jgi:hypothetical protein
VRRAQTGVRNHCRVSPVFCCVCYCFIDAFSCHCRNVHLQWLYYWPPIVNGGSNCKCRLQFWHYLSATGSTSRRLLTTATAVMFTMKASAMFLWTTTVKQANWTLQYNPVVHRAFLDPLMRPGMYDSEGMRPMHPQPFPPSLHFPLHYMPL